MGCGASNLDDVPYGLVTTARLRPIFHRRIEGIRKRHAARSLNKATPSKKLLLRSSQDDYVDQEITGHHKMHVLTSEEDSKNPSSSMEEGLTGKAKLQHETIKFNVPEKGMLECNVREDQKAEEAKDENGEDSGDDEGRRIGHDNDNGDFPGSPSFRIYYKDNEKGDSPRSSSFRLHSTESADDDQNESDNEHQHLKEAASGIPNTAQSEVALSSKDSTTKIVKKGTKKRSLRQAMKGKHGP